MQPQIPIPPPNSNKANGPHKGRKYSLSHSDDTGELFLTIGREFYIPDDQTVTGEFDKDKEEEDDLIRIYVDIDAGGPIESSEKRDFIFRRELPLALAAIAYGDKMFLKNHDLLDALVVVHFKSRFAKFNVVEQWGRIGKFLKD